VPVLSLENHLGSEPAGIQEHSLIEILKIMSLPFLSLMGNLIIACKGVGHLRNLARIVWLSSSTVSLHVVWVVLSVKYLGGLV